MGYRINQEIGKKIKKFREDRGLTQEELAYQLKMHYTSISRIERGEANPSVYTIYRITQVLKKNMRELF